MAICEKHNIVLEAWAPLARAMRFDHPALVKVADRLKRDKAQILLRWGLQHVSAAGASAGGKNR